MQRCCGMQESADAFKGCKLPADFVEGMACMGGCVGGPSKHKSEEKPKRQGIYFLARQIPEWCTRI